MDVIFHIGSPKSASSSLQRNLFFCHPMINFIGTNNCCKADIYTYFFYDCLIFGNGIRKSDFIGYYPKRAHKDILTKIKFTSVVELADYLYEKHIKSKLSSTKMNVFSSEKFSMECPDMLFQSKLKYATHEEKASMIYRYFPDAKILYIIRNQKTALLSYMNYRIGKTKNKLLFLYRAHRLKRKLIKPICDYFDYNKVIESYIIYFKRVHVSALESINNIDTLNRMSDLLNISAFDVNSYLNKSKHKNVSEVFFQKGSLEDKLFLKYFDGNAKMIKGSLLDANLKYPVVKKQVKSE